MRSLRRPAKRLGTICGVLLLASLAAGCSGDPPPPIDVDEGALVVRNLSDRGWRDVRIVVNYWYNGNAREIRSGSFVRAPLTQFVAAAGQKFDPVKTPLETVVVTAVDDAGTPVKLSWDRKTQPARK